MPNYDYVCETCGKEFEMFQSMKDEALKVCPCGKEGRVTRKIGSGAGLLFKGSGFYITDYRKGPKPAGEGAPKAGESKAGEPKTPAPTKNASEPKSSST